jgi:TolA-binding protein
VFYRAVAAAVFNEPGAETLFRSAIRESPNSEEAYQAYDWLANLYLKSGRYQSLIAVMDQRWATFPNKKDVASERKALAPFRGLPARRMDD